MNSLVYIGDVALSRRHPLDGAMGTELQRRFGIRGEAVVRSSIENPAAVASVYNSYKDAGAQALTTGTLVVASEPDAASLVTASVTNALRIKSPVFASFAPTNSTDLARASSIAVDAGASLILIETALRLDELCASVEAVRTACPKTPIVASIVPSEKGRVALGCGTPAEDCAIRLRDAGVDAVGANCAPPPVVLHFLSAVANTLPADFPLLARPSAGIPTENGVSWSYPWEPHAWAESCYLAISTLPTLILGGCCGAGPRHIASLATMLAQE